MTKDANQSTPEQRQIAEIITRVIGTTPEELLADPEQARNGLRAALGGVFAAMQSSNPAEPDLEPARAFARRVRSVLLAHDIDAPEAIERLPDDVWRLGKGTRSLDTARLGQILHDLADFVSTPNQTPLDPAVLVEWLERNVGPLLDPNNQQAQRAEKAREALRVQIRGDIVESLRARGFKPPESSR